MQELILRNESYWWAYTGRKVSTSRNGVRDIRLGKLTFYNADDNGTSLTVCVSRVSLCRFGNLTEEEAKLEGYDSLADLKETLNKIYGPEIPDDRIFTLISWERF